MEPNGLPDDRRRKLVAGNRDRHVTVLPTKRLRAVVHVTRPSEMINPASDCLVRNCNSALGEQILDVTKLSVNRR
jgi:hypothetical protein